MNDVENIESDKGKAGEINFDGNNLFLYWTGYTYKLITILRHLIYKHSFTGNGYTVHLITPDNVMQYIADLPICFFSLLPAHQADVVRVFVICQYGGIWLDSDTLVCGSLDQMFQIIDNKEVDFPSKKGWFVLQNNQSLCNGAFGSRAGTPLMVEWKKRICELLRERSSNQNGEVNLLWTEIGNNMLNTMYHADRSLFAGYRFFLGLNTVYPVNFDKCVDKFIKDPYDSYKQIEKPFQPFIILVNSVYRYLEAYSIDHILSMQVPLNYFLNKSKS